MNTETEPQGCNCLCSCPENATTTDDQGVPVCDVCVDFCVDERGDVVCGRMTDRFRKCHICDVEITWGPSQYGDPGSGTPSQRIGTCGCGDVWLDQELGCWGHYSYAPTAERTGL